MTEHSKNLPLTLEQLISNSTTAWRVGEQDSFHEELGYWLWDPKEMQVIRCFMIPRGVTVLAGGKVDPGAKEYEETSFLKIKGRADLFEHRDSDQLQRVVGS